MVCGVCVRGPGSVRSFVGARRDATRRERRRTSWISRDLPSGARVICIRLILISAPPSEARLRRRSDGNQVKWRIPTGPHDGSLHPRIQVTAGRIRLRESIRFEIVQPSLETESRLAVEPVDRRATIYLPRRKPRASSKVETRMKKFATSKGIVETVGDCQKRGTVRRRDALIKNGAQRYSVERRGTTLTPLVRIFAQLEPRFWQRTLDGIRRGSISRCETRTSRKRLKPVHGDSRRCVARRDGSRAKIGLSSGTQPAKTRPTERRIEPSAIIINRSLYQGRCVNIGRD